MVSFVKCLLVASDVGSDDNDDVGENVSESFLVCRAATTPLSSCSKRSFLLYGIRT